MTRKTLNCENGPVIAAHDWNPLQIFTNHSEALSHIPIVMKKTARSLILATMLAATLPAAPQQGQWDRNSLDDVRKAREKGDTYPTSEIFRRLKREYGGFQIDAVPETRDGRRVYVIDWQTGKGERMRIIVDARTGRTLSTN